MRMSNSTVKRHLAIVLALTFSMLSYLAPVRAAGKAPTVKGGTVKAGSQIVLKISKKAKCKIQTVEAYSDARAKVRVKKATKTSVTVEGLQAPGANVYVYIVYKYPKAKAQQVLKKVAVKVTGTTDVTPENTPTPTVAPSAMPTATATSAPVQTPSPAIRPTLKPPADPDAVVCPDCHGTGQVNDTTCPTCGGTGWLIPAG